VRRDGHRWDAKGGLGSLALVLAACGWGGDGDVHGRPAPPPERSQQAVDLSRDGRLLSNMDIGEWEFDLANRRGVGRGGRGRRRRL
jgi:hypothetical protein